MKDMHNLGTVFRFEVSRTLKKKSFWIVSLMFPVMAAVIAGIIFLSNKETDTALEKAKNERFSVAVIDESSQINPLLLASFKPSTVSNKQDGIDKVKSGQLDAFFYYPQHLDKQNVEVYARDVGLFDNSKYSAVAKMILDESVAMTVSKDVKTTLQNKYNLSTTTYRNGEIYDGFKQLIAPGVFLVLFYLMIATFGNQMLNSSIEEKENRVIEMILTTVRAKTLVIGKILSLVTLGLLQMTIVLIPIVIGYLLLHDKLSLPAVDLSNLPLDWGRIGVSFAIFIASFLLFTGLLVTFGAMFPTAKEAGMFFGVVMMLIFGPLYAAPLFVTSPDSPFVQFLSYFPLTAPIPLLLRNAVGNLELWEAMVAIIILAITAVIVLNLAVRVFKQGALEYSRKLSLKEVFSR